MTISHNNIVRNVRLVKSFVTNNGVNGYLLANSSPDGILYPYIVAVRNIDRVLVFEMHVSLNRAASSYIENIVRYA